MSDSKKDSKETEEKIISEEDFIDHELSETVQSDSELKSIIINYVGNKFKPEDNQVTLLMVIETFAEEFGEFLLPIAEENFIRGYQQAMSDVEDGEKFLTENGVDDTTSFEELDKQLRALENSDEREDA